MCKSIFGGNIYVRSMFSCVRTSHDLRARAHMHSLEGTLVVNLLHFFLHLYLFWSCYCWAIRRYPSHQSWCGI